MLVSDLKIQQKRVKSIPVVADGYISANRDFTL
jgi:hypothetical protein